MSTAPAIPADVLARALGLPSPTPDQRAVIEAPLEPALVVAGAGSGKTETMAGRVVWLVANGLVEPEHVLGLTFTRKAAGELAERIERRLSTVREYSSRGLLPHLTGLVSDGTLPVFWETHAESTARERDSAFAILLDSLAARLSTGRAPEQISAEQLVLGARVATYNAFADALVREHGARIGREADAALLSQSGSWLLARRVVISSDDERLGEREDAFSTIVDAVHRLAGDVLDNRVDLDELSAFGLEWSARLSTVRCRLKGDQDRVDKAARALSGLPMMADLVREYARRKRADDTLDFADQVSDALTIVERAPDVAASLREQYRVVLLDEYQDTSVLQTRLLAAIFRDTGVMAVGDPHQSIYGWRGASADNLRAFPLAFASDGEAARYRLMISWRNDAKILAAANALLAASSGADVADLAPRPGAAEGRVVSVFAPTVEDEAREVAEWFARVRAAHAASGASRPHSGAVLFRTKRHMQLFAEALDAAGVPNRILGLGGLLSTPEVVDVVSALRVVHDPVQGSALLRILAGPRFAIGVADLAALHALADTLSRRDASLDLLPAELAARVRSSAGADEQLSIIDALEFLRRVRDDHAFLRDFTLEGRRRLRDAGEMFDRLRRAVGQPIPDLIRLIESELRLDIELAANEARGPARLSSARLRTFLDEVRAFLLADDRGSVGSLLAWLDHAEETDELMPRPEPPEPGVVQLLTIHGSKGLEWDAVAVVRLVDKELPKEPRTKLGWLGFGTVPYPLRGDRSALPVLDWRLDDADEDLPDALKRFFVAEGEHQEREERRLAYVAVTRARSDLLLTGSHWAGQQRARTPSRYLREMIEALDLATIDEEAPEENPYLDKGGRLVAWPLDPLGARRGAVESAADAVERAAEGEVRPDEILERLLAEQERRRTGLTVKPPARIPASRFKDYVTDYSGTVAAVARPLPERPFRQTRLGTLFHAWVEQRSGRAGSGTSVDDALWEIDEESSSDAAVADADDLARLKAVFEASEWASLSPLEVETEIDFAMSTGDGERHVMICKLDAVYRRADRGGRIEIVDWKTGKAPVSKAERDERMLQLALYRLAYHKKHGVPLEDIDVTLYYVADDLVIRSDTVWTEHELAERWRNASRAGGGAAQAS